MLVHVVQYISATIAIIFAIRHFFLSCMKKESWNDKFVKCIIDVLIIVLVIILLRFKF